MSCCCCCCLTKWKRIRHKWVFSSERGVECLLLTEVMNISTGSYSVLAAICAFNTSALPLQLNINYFSSWRNNAAHWKLLAFTKLIISNLQQNTCQSFTKQTEKVVHRVSSHHPQRKMMCWHHLPLHCLVVSLADNEKHQGRAGKHQIWLQVFTPCLVFIRALREETAFEGSEGQWLSVSALTTDLNKGGCCITTSSHCTKYPGSIHAWTKRKVLGGKS